jgi:Flp pilus assembly pilin Flp
MLMTSTGKQGGLRNMNFLTKLYVRVSEKAGQTMTEYALIMAAIAIVCFAAYNALGTEVKTLVQNVTLDL